MEVNNGYGLTFVLMASILYGKANLCTSQCMDDNLVRFLPDNGHYEITMDYALKGHLLSSITTRSQYVCASECTRDVNCNSFNYSPDTRTCELNHGTDALNPGDLEPETGFDYFKYAWSRFKGCTFTTPSGHCFQFLFPRLPDGTKRLEFSVKTGADAFIGLTTENRITDTMYLIDIGGHGGATIFIRKCKTDCGNDHSTTSPTNLVSDQEYRRFWITFENGLIRIGRHLDATPITEWQETGDVIPIHYVSFASWNTYAGDWILHSFCDPPWEWES